ncbi:hypothetical protein NL676_010065 [Syzygium grande]|nr:hypothetical protein NL676_010065 [Syzygium grande]
MARALVKSKNISLGDDGPRGLPSSPRASSSPALRKESDGLGAKLAALTEGNERLSVENEGPRAELVALRGGERAFEAADRVPKKGFLEQTAFGSSTRLEEFRQISSPSSVIRSPYRCSSLRTYEPFLFVVSLSCRKTPSSVAVPFVSYREGFVLSTNQFNLLLPVLCFLCYTEA